MPNQIANRAGRDIAGRDIIYGAHQRTPMTTLIEQFRAEAESDQQLSCLIEKLEHYFSNSTSADIRSLQEKLTSAGREDLLRDALAKKETAYKLIMRNQGSKSAQLIFAYVLAEIVVNFEQAVRPLVQEGAARSVVDRAILDHVITPACRVLEDNPLMLDKLDIQGFLYFLGGNCHIRWDQC